MTRLYFYDHLIKINDALCQNEGNNTWPFHHRYYEGWDRLMGGLEMAVVLSNISQMYSSHNLLKYNIEKGKFP